MFIRRRVYEALENKLEAYRKKISDCQLWTRESHRLRREVELLEAEVNEWNRKYFLEKKKVTKLQAYLRTLKGSKR